MEEFKQNVVVTDVNIQFWTLVGLMVKFTFPSIPALFIIFIFGGFLLQCLQVYLKRNKVFSAQTN